MICSMWFSLILSASSGKVGSRDWCALVWSGSDSAEGARSATGAEFEPDRRTPTGEGTIVTNAYRLICGGTDTCPYMIVNATGLPDLPLTLFANELRHSLSQGSIRVYVREVLSLANWASTDALSRRNQWTLLASPERVRHLVREYLTI